MVILTRPGIEILLDRPGESGLVVSAYADMRVQDGFHRYVRQHLDNLAAGAARLVGEARARKELEQSLEVVREAARDNVDPSARGLAVFAGISRGLRQVMPLEYPVENRLVIDEEPFILPLMERWYGEPPYLAALFDSNQAHLFEARYGRSEPLGDLVRDDACQDIQRDKPRFTYKKRFAATRHERLQGTEDAPFFREVARTIADHWKDQDFAGLILLGKPQHTSAVRGQLPRELESLVVGEASHPLATPPDELADDAARLAAEWESRREREILTELNERRKENHLVATGPTDVLDAVQQGRAVQVLLGARRDVPGAHCPDCGYHFGAPVGVCPYCQGRCRTVNAVQDIMRLAIRHGIAVHLFRIPADRDPLQRCGGIAALLRAPAHWAPNSRLADATEGRPGPS
jgi:peptide subunit release factor 1 (eRF1)